MLKVNIKGIASWLFVLIIQGSCESQGRRGLSDNINESKRRNVFVAEYDVKPNPYVINDSLSLKVKHAWVEYRWGYGDTDSESTIIHELYQLVIETQPGCLKNYGLTWRIGINGDHYIRSCGTNCLMSDFSYLPKDVEEWDVQSGWKLDSLSKKNIIGRFKIQKKENN